METEKKIGYLVSFIYDNLDAVYKIEYEDTDDLNNYIDLIRNNNGFDFFLDDNQIKDLMVSYEKVKNDKPLNIKELLAEMEGVEK